MNPLNLPTSLANHSNNIPQFSVESTSLSGERVKLADPNVSRALVAIMDYYAVAGGAASHWGGPAAFAEIISAVHGLMFSETDRQWHQSYNFINDAGHAENGIYAIRANYGFNGLTLNDLLKFRSIEGPLTGHGESHVNPEGVLLSNGPLSSSVAQAQGLAHGDRIVGRDRVTLLTVSDGALMEGEAKEAMASIPGMAGKEKLNPFVMIISDNNTKLSGRISEDSFSMNPSFESLNNLGWKVIRIDDGHNLGDVFQKIEQAVDEAKNDPTKPVAVWAKTIKGKGVKSTEESSSGGHGFPLKKNDPKITEFVQEIFSGNAPEEILSLLPKEAPQQSSSSSVKKEKVQVGIAKAMIRAKKAGLPIYSVSSDLQGSTGVKNFQKEFPDSYFDIGIAEANMVSVGAGLAKAGLIPVVDTFAQFGVTKGNLPLTMASLSSAPVIAVFSHTGMQDAADGASHQATTYLSAVAAIPQTEVISCSCSEEAEHYMFQAFERYKSDRENGSAGKSYIFFIGRENFTPSLGQKNFTWNKAQILTQGSAATVLAHGPMVHQALAAHKALIDQGEQGLTVVNHPFLNSIDTETITNSLRNTAGRLVSIEDHQAKAGFGALLAHQLAQEDVSVKLRSLGIKEHFGRSAYTANQLYSSFNIDQKAIINSLSSF